MSIFTSLIGCPKGGDHDWSMVAMNKVLPDKVNGKNIVVPLHYLEMCDKCGKERKVKK